jgi:hypothetical protein
LSYRSFALWVLGHPEAALADAEQALRDAREIVRAELCERQPVEQTARLY